MDRWLPSFVDELEKIAVSRRLSTYGPQARLGRRPIRVSKMIEKDSKYWDNRLRGKPGEENWKNSENREDSDQAKQYEHEGYQQYTSTPESGDDKGQSYFSSGA